MKELQCISSRCVIAFRGVLVEAPGGGICRACFMFCDDMPPLSIKAIHREAG